MTPLEVNQMIKFKIFYGNYSFILLTHHFFKSITTTATQSLHTRQFIPIIYEY